MYGGVPKTPASSQASRRVMEPAKPKSHNFARKPNLGGVPATGRDEPPSPSPRLQHSVSRCCSICQLFIFGGLSPTGCHICVRRSSGTYRYCYCCCYCCSCCRCCPCHSLNVQHASLLAYCGYRTPPNPFHLPVCLTVGRAPSSEVFGVGVGHCRSSVVKCMDLVCRPRMFVVHLSLWLLRPPLPIQMWSLQFVGRFAF